MQGQQLKQRVEAHELQAGLTEDFRPRHALERLVHDRFGMRIAIMARIAEQCTATTEQREIDAPGIDTQRIDASALGNRLVETDEHLSPQVQYVPVQRVQGAHGPVLKAVDDFETEALAIE